MYETDVIIVGAGPSGLTLAVALSQLQIQSLVIEKQHDICEDPRAIALAGDAWRILSLVGISVEEMARISQPISELQFHDRIFTSEPFLRLEQTPDWAGHALPNTSVNLQPGLEQLLRDRAQSSDMITLKLDCEVVGIDQNASNVEITYEEKYTHRRQTIRGKYVVGADGKRGFVRKSFLEEKGIKQETGQYRYEATWVAANLKLTMPTPDTHPQFPLWDLGYEPEELWDLFWPKGWHFCNHPVMPVATGRFGPISEKYWRFEYELPPNFALPENVMTHLEEQMNPHLTLAASSLRRNGRQPNSPVRFPWDCVEILRCGPAHFAQKVVNRWFDGRTILIGDAAHVFPPFAAQGILNGVRDALGLCWRLELLIKGPKKTASNMETSSFDSELLLSTWSNERRHGVDESANQTAENEYALQIKSNALRWAIWCADTAMSWAMPFRQTLIRSHFCDRAGFRGAKGGFFLESEGGGVKTAQIFVQGIKGNESVELSDKLLRHHKAALTILVLHDPTSEEELARVHEVLKRLNIPTNFLAENVIILNDRISEQQLPRRLQGPLFLTPARTAMISRAGYQQLPLYDPGSFRMRFQANAKYALVRPDFIIFSQAQTLEQLESQICQACSMVTNS
ncbi:hypothetical protein PFICI_02402 [Pestalotiopsis fici W106-1]|uniref:FAD-binding domain-containing protein n=1 Tax=Pestalotiopsis fici (strain W106-1 / CGMCC3.15140) TaxID=1229662 RepID=W3XG35_PESFW|nr:uncharacterized protein PFICI_02402 [Pestalotiopsis fici W106-1]ETS84377.1 hypothetical protein PFICI_02402 [Pestalotiopsis fici W106-1]